MACKAKGGKPRRFIERASAEMVKETRHAESDGPEEPDGDEILSEGVSPLDPKQAPDTRPPRRRRPYRYFEFGPEGAKHRYRTLDPDAGVRTYRNKKSWLGGYFQPMVSVLVDAPVAFEIFPADWQEYDPYEDLHLKGETAAGCLPGAVSLDRYFSYERVFKFNTTRGIASVIPWRKRRGKEERGAEDADRYDRHGIPRCQHCGGPGLIEAPKLGLVFDKDTPRLRFTCQLQLLAECDTTQSIACEEDWRLLVPLSRRTERYHALAKAGKNLEHVFRHWRDRYQVAGNNPDTRPRRPGMAWQNLRASAALLIEWLYLSLRNGWMGSYRRRNRDGEVVLRAEKRLQRVLAARRRHGLDLPRGDAAVRAGFAAGGGGPPPAPSGP